jgi:hypothetical protein
MKIKALARLAAGVALVVVTAPAFTQSTSGGAKYGSFGVDLTAQKAGVKPGDDFWTFANGGWNERTQIAPDRASAGYGTQLSIETTWRRTRPLMAPPASRSATSTPAGWTRRGSRRAALRRSSPISPGSPQ